MPFTERRKTGEDAGLGTQRTGLDFEHVKLGTSIRHLSGSIKRQLVLEPEVQIWREM